MTGHETINEKSYIPSNSGYDEMGEHKFGLKTNMKPAKTNNPLALRTSAKTKNLKELPDFHLIDLVVVLLH